MIILSFPIIGYRSILDGVSIKSVIIILLVLALDKTIIMLVGKLLQEKDHLMVDSVLQIIT